MKAFDQSEWTAELDRLQQFLELMLQKARDRADRGEQQAIQWVELYQQKAVEIRRLKASPQETGANSQLDS